MQESAKKGRMDWWQAAGSALLLALLAVSGYAGAVQKPAQAVSVPATYETITAWEIAAQSMEDIRERLVQERRQEIELLDSVLARSQENSELALQALAQKMQLAERMETEAQVAATLAYMGYEQVNVVCGAGSMTLIAPWQIVSEEPERVKLIAAAAGQAQIPAERVKIILPKNE